MSSTKGLSPIRIQALIATSMACAYCHEYLNRCACQLWQGKREPCEHPVEFSMRAIPGCSVCACTAELTTGQKVTSTTDLRHRA